ncbi:MAG: hypothetical protein HY314_11235 [Acidobacteria bacterium]|nr:hypothetical protein [Acidobacteriota bacterium]
MPQLSFSFEHHYDSLNVNERVRVPIRLRLGSVVTNPLLPHWDTGSPLNIFRAEIAALLGIAYQNGVPATIGTASGGTFQAYGLDIILEIIGVQSYDTTIYFAPWLPGVGPDIGVLGLRDFATKLRIGLIHYDRMLYLSDYNEP